MCLGYGQPRVDITWMRNGGTISNSSVVSISNENTAHGERLLHRSFLQITNVEEADAGVYTCTVSSGEVSVAYSSILLTVAGEFDNSL